MVLVTSDFLDKGKSANGGWSIKQVQCLGLDRFRHGWFKKCIGRKISDESAKLFLDLKNNHFKPKKERFGYVKKEAPEFESVTQEPKTILTWKEQYNHPLWQKKRLEIMQRDLFKCCVCGSSEKLLHVHHNTYDGKYIWSCHSSSMITLCDDCHNVFHLHKNSKL